MVTIPDRELDSSRAALSARRLIDETTTTATTVSVVIRMRSDPRLSPHWNRRPASSLATRSGTTNSVPSHGRTATATRGTTETTDASTATKRRALAWGGIRVLAADTATGTSNKTRPPHLMVRCLRRVRQAVTFGISAPTATGTSRTRTRATPEGAAPGRKSPGRYLTEPNGNVVGTPRTPHIIAETTKATGTLRTAASAASNTSNELGPAPR